MKRDSDPSTTQQPPAVQPHLQRVAIAAAKSGLTKKAFVAACMRGDIPVPLHRVGPLLYAETRPLMAWIGGSAAASLVT